MRIFGAPFLFIAVAATISNRIQVDNDGLKQLESVDQVLPASTANHDPRCHKCYDFVKECLTGMLLTEDDCKDIACYERNEDCAGCQQMQCSSHIESFVTVFKKDATSIDITKRDWIKCMRCRYHVHKCFYESKKSLTECRQINCKGAPNMCGGCCNSDCPAKKKGVCEVKGDPTCTCPQ